MCGRTMLKGEQAEPYLAPSRERKLVCSLCAPRAQQEGWIRESAAPGHARPAAAHRRAPRDPALQRAGGAARRAGRAGARSAPAQRSEEEPRPTTEAAADPTQQLAASGASARRPRSPRHVRAVPTNAQLKIERALELFNDSEHRRTVTGHQPHARDAAGERLHVAASRRRRCC